MINYDSIISVFNEKGTLIKWLKKVEKALKESVLTNVEILQGQDDSIAFKFTFQDNTTITTDYVTISATLLHNLIIGSDTVVVDLNELQNKLIVKLDEEYKKTLATKADIENLQNQVTEHQTQITDLQNNKIEKTDGVITSNLIANDSIITTKIPDNTITSAKIANHQVTDDKLTTTTLNKINKSLQTPTTAPTSTELVGIDTNKAQTNINIGEGLTLENGTLKATGGGGGGSSVLYNHSIDLYNTSGKSLSFTFMCSIAKFNNKEELRTYFNAPRQKSSCIGVCTQDNINYVIFTIGGSNANNIFSLEYFSYIDEETKTDFTLMPIDFDMSDITDFTDNVSEV